MPIKTNMIVNIQCAPAGGEQPPNEIVVNQTPVASTSSFQSCNCCGSSTSFANASLRKFSNASKSLPNSATSPSRSIPENAFDTGKTSSTASSAAKNAG